MFQKTKCSNWRIITKHCIESWKIITKSNSEYGPCERLKFSGLTYSISLRNKGEIHPDLLKYVKLFILAAPQEKFTEEEFKCLKVIKLINVHYLFYNHITDNHLRITSIMVEV